MVGASARLWLLLAGISLGDLVLCGARGITLSHWWPFAAIAAALLGVIAAHRLSGASPRFAGFAEWILLWSVFSVGGALLTYLAAAQNTPLYDARLAQADAGLGFDWQSWFSFVSARPLLKIPLAVAYASLLPQVLLSILWFSMRRWPHRIEELLTNATVALLLTTALFCLYPTLGPCADVPACNHDPYLEDLKSLRNGNLPSFNMMMLKGVIAFPSFHAVLAVLFTFAHRRSPLLLPVAAFNGLMLLSLPSEGGHYLVDVPGGIAVGFLAILATRVLPMRSPALAPAPTA
jgi:hypothetical protein